MLASIDPYLQRCLNFILPPRCLMCFERCQNQGSLCSTCWGKLNFITAPFCQRCGIPFEFQVEGALVCASCLDHPPIFDQARSVAQYNEASKQILMGFKHGDMLHYSHILAQWMSASGQALLARTDLIIPVPLHPWRLMVRQYNQAAVLGNYISKLTGVNKCNNLLVRTRHTASQGHKSVKDRGKNVKSAFKLNPNYKGNIKGQSVLIIDDVLTTGATVNECAATLKQAGAGQVNVLTFARVMKPGRT